MAHIEVSGIGIEYELVGEPGAPAVALTAGGRFSKDVPGLREMADKFVAGGRRVLLWDRPNCGASDLCFEGEHESLLHARALTQLIRALNLGPTVLAGGSAGSRTHLIAAVVDPEVVSHLAQWWISGGVLSLMALGTNYCCAHANAALLRGMAAVAELPAWSEQLQRNPKNREILLKQDRDQFVATMERWGAAFIPSDDSPVPGMSREDFAGLKMPVLIFRGSPRDLYHPARICEEVHKLIPHSVLMAPAWDNDVIMDRVSAAMVSGSGHFVDWHMLVPQILEFSR